MKTNCLPLPCEDSQSLYNWRLLQVLRHLFPMHRLLFGNGTAPHCDSGQSVCQLVKRIYSLSLPPWVVLSWVVWLLPVVMAVFRSVVFSVWSVATIPVTVAIVVRAVVVGVSALTVITPSSQSSNFTTTTVTVASKVVEPVHERSKKVISMVS